MNAGQSVVLGRTFPVISAAQDREREDLGPAAACLQEWRSAWDICIHEAAAEGQSNNCAS